MASYILDCRSKQSYPAFWITGGLIGPAFVVMGAKIINQFMKIDPAKRDFMMFVCGIFAIILGLLLLGGVIYTMVVMGSPDDLSFKVDIHRAKGRKRYDANRLVNFLERSHNNVLLFNSDEGQMRVYGCKGKLIVEICIEDEEGMVTYQLTNPNETDEGLVIVGNIFLERFPVWKNRIVSKEMAVKAIETLYDKQNLKETADSLSVVNTTEETRRLIVRDAYILPEVPFIIPKKPEDRDKRIKEKEEREKRAIEELCRN